MSHLARRMSADDDMFRAVVQRGDRVEYHGPFARVASAKARRTQRVNELNHFTTGLIAVGWVEKATVAWEKVE